MIFLKVDSFRCSWCSVYLIYVNLQLSDGLTLLSTWPFLFRSISDPIFDQPGVVRNPIVLSWTCHWPTHPERTYRCLEDYSPLPGWCWDCFCNCVPFSMYVLQCYPWMVLLLFLCIVSRSITLLFVSPGTKLQRQYGVPGCRKNSVFLVQQGNWSVIVHWRHGCFPVASLPRAWLCMDRIVFIR